MYKLCVHAVESGCDFDCFKSCVSAGVLACAVIVAVKNPAELIDVRTAVSNPE
jgi:hypothetical protein